MTPEEVTRRVEAIAAISFDDERAHSMEDILHTDVLFEIAKRAKQSAPILAAMAEEALKTQELEFCRWCA